MKDDIVDESGIFHQMTGSLEWLVNMMSEVEINIVSVERIKEYTETPQEVTFSEIFSCYFVLCYFNITLCMAVLHLLRNIAS